MKKSNYCLLLIIFFTSCKGQVKTDFAKSKSANPYFIGIERSEPRHFLTTDEICAGFSGDTIKVHGLIKNIATVTSYKNAVVKLTYYSSTKKVLGHKEYKINEVFPPHSNVRVELKIEEKIENYKDVKTIGWDLIQATAN